MEPFSHAMKDSFCDGEGNDNVSGGSYQLENGDSSKVHEEFYSVPQRHEEVLKRIEELVMTLLQHLKDESPPVLNFYNRRCWKNVSVINEIMKGSENTSVSLNFANPQSRSHIALIFYILSLVYRINMTNSSSTKREVFYQCLGTLKRLKYSSNQAIVDAAIADIGALIEIPPRLLGVLPSSRGMVAGNLSVVSFQLTEDSNDPFVFLDVDSYGNEAFPIPGEMAPLSYEGVVVKSTARLVLIVEKDASFQKIINDGGLERLKPCILLTGKGYPDVATRRLVHLIRKSLNVPIVALVDADPHGIEIMCVYRFGSLAMSLDAEDLAVPDIQWLGVHPSDITALSLPIQSLVPLEKEGIAKAEALLKRPYVTSNPLIFKQIEILLEGKQKAEIEALCSISPTYITDVYIPGKMASNETI